MIPPMPNIGMIRDTIKTTIIENSSKIMKKMRGTVNDDDDHDENADDSDDDSSSSSCSSASSSSSATFGDVRQEGDDDEAPSEATKVQLPPRSSTEVPGQEEAYQEWRKLQLEEAFDKMAPEDGRLDCEQFALALERKPSDPFARKLFSLFDKARPF